MRSLSKSERAGQGGPRRPTQLALWGNRRQRRWAALADLAEAAAVTGDLSLGEARELAAAAAGVRFPNPATRRKLATLTGWLFRYLAGAGAADWSDVTPDMVEGWCGAAARRGRRWTTPAPSTVRNRQWAFTIVCDALEAAGVVVDPALRPGREPRPPAARRSRPLTPAELDRVRAFADRGLSGSRRSVMVALAEAGASASEIAAVVAEDIDLDAGTVRLGRRVNPLTGWGAEAIGRFFAVHGDPGPGSRMCVTDRVSGHRGAQSVAVQLREVVSDAGLGPVADVTAGSVRLTTAAEVLAQDGVEAAARFLGSDSLDSTAAALGHDWNNSDDADTAGGQGG